MTTKEAVLKLLEASPDDAAIEDIQYHLYLLQRIQAGKAAADEGETIPHEELMLQLAQWLE